MSMTDTGTNVLFFAISLLNSNNSSRQLPASPRSQPLTIKMRVVLVSGGVMAGVGKGGFLALLDVFPVVSLQSHPQNSTSHPPVRVTLRVQLLVQLDRSFWLAKSLTPPDV